MRFLYHVRCRFRGTLVGVIILCVSNDNLKAAYLPGSAPTVGEIQHECVEAPEPLDRTDIGIGEKFRLWIDPDTWADDDIERQFYLRDQNVADDIGQVTWVVQSGDGEVYPVVGYETELTAGIVNSTATIIIRADIQDSTSLGWDAIVQKTKQLFPKVPTAVQVYDVTHITTASLAQAFGWALGPPHNTFGQGDLYLWNVSGLVSFRNVNFREHIVAQNFTWPDGTQVGGMDAFTTPGRKPQLPLIPVLGKFNMIGNEVIYGLVSKNKLLQNAVHQDFAWTRIVPWEWQDKNGNWNFLGDTEHNREVKKIDFKFRSELKGTDGSIKTGTRQGPWQ